MAVVPGDRTTDAIKRRFLVEVWWEPRERRLGRPVLRGRVKELPEGIERSISKLSQIGVVIGDALRRSPHSRGKAT